MVWLLFALASNVLYSVVSILDQLLRKRHVKHDTSLTVIWLAFFFLIWLAVIPFIHISVPEFPKLAAALIAGFIVVIASLPYFYALSVEEASKVMPIWQFSSIFVLVFSAIFLGEKLASRHYYGFALMFFGGLLLSVSKAVRGFEVNKTLLLILATSAVSSVYLVLVKFFYATESFWNGFFWLSLGNFIGAVFLLALPKNFKYVKRQLAALTKGAVLLLIATTLMTFLADISLLFAVKAGPVSLVSVIGVTQIMFLFLMTVFLSKYFPKVLKERIDRKALLTKLAAIALLIVGLYLVR